MSAASLVYVYAVLDKPVDVDAQGIDELPVRWVSENALAAAVSEVAAEDFEEEPLNTNVRNLGWLGPRALAHQDVTARLFEASEAVVPLTFGTVFRDDDRVRHLLSEQNQALKSRLDAVRGCAEWVVALHLLQQPDAAQSTAVTALRHEIESSSPGRGHLLRRRLETLERDEAQRITAEAAESALGTLRQAARDVYVEPLPADAVERPLLRASVLVTRERETAFMDHVDRLRQQWPEPTYRLLLTGPWPPYRFGGLAEPRA
jgi:hypothetical protein